MYFVLALRSAFRNELSYGAKTPIDTVCITPVCNDRCLRVCAILSLSLSLLLVRTPHFTRKPHVPRSIYTDTPVFNLVRGSSVVTECHRAITIRPSCRVSHQFATRVRFLADPTRFADETISRPSRSRSNGNGIMIIAADLATMRGR